VSTVQEEKELSAFYSEPDPWGYYSSKDDARRRVELLSLLPKQDYDRVLDVGCGNGFITFHLPGRYVLGIDVADAAIDWAKQAAMQQSQPDRFGFEHASLFDRHLGKFGRFNLVVLTGVLYDQYIGRARSVALYNLDGLIVDGGIVVSCHIRQWAPVRLPYTLLDMAIYPYRDFTHQLEVFRK
jgi:2-polyprenyl-3-methyl-5-hydroxy-6-metoxy-1,4-benzoquinol methylase